MTAQGMQRAVRRRGNSTGAPCFPQALRWLLGGLSVAIASQAGALPPVYPLYAPCIAPVCGWLAPGLQLATWSGGGPARNSHTSHPPPTLCSRRRQDVLPTRFGGRARCPQRAASVRRYPKCACLNTFPRRARDSAPYLQKTSADCSRRLHTMKSPGYAAGTRALICSGRSSQPLMTWKVWRNTREPAGGTPYLAT